MKNNKDIKKKKLPTEETPVEDKKPDAVFHVFTNDIYPAVRLYISITNSLTAISDTFTNDNEDRTEIKDLPDRCAAITMNVINKKTNENGVLIVFRKRNYMTSSTVAHESFHAMDNIASWLSIEFIDGAANEALAYLIGWIVDCCYQVKTNKFKYE